MARQVVLPSVQFSVVLYILVQSWCFWFSEIYCDIVDQSSGASQLVGSMRFICFIFWYFFMYTLYILVGVICLFFVAYILTLLITVPSVAGQVVAVQFSSVCFRLSFEDDIYALYSEIVDHSSARSGGSWWQCSQFSSVCFG